MDIMQYVDTAKERSGAKSNRKLCELMSVSPIWVVQLKKGNLPTDENMLKLAEIAHIPPQQALLDLNIWRASGKAKAVYQALKVHAQSATLSVIMSPLLCQMVSQDIIYYVN